MKAILTRLIAIFTVLVFVVTIWSAGSGSAAGQAGKPGPATISVDVSSAQSSYANFARVTGTPEEVIVDFALNDQPFGPPKEALRVEHRIIMNVYTAKRLTAAMQMAIERHEKVFGPIEIDAEKRVKEKL